MIGNGKYLVDFFLQGLHYGIFDRMIAPRDKVVPTLDHQAGIEQPFCMVPFHLGACAGHI
jgi:hypothetical protein